MRQYYFLAILLIAILANSSCYYDKEELLYGVPNAPCTDTTTTASYSQKVVPLFQQYCYSCHNSGFPSGGIAMGTYAADKTIGQNGKLYGSVNHSPGFSPMPKGMAKMTSCQIAAIKNWIDNGLPNN